MKNFNDTIGNRTRDLPACSAVPQPTAPQRGPSVRIINTVKEEENRTNKNGASNNKWVSFSYVGKETKLITKLFDNSNVNISCTATNTIEKLLAFKQQECIDKYSGNGIYTLNYPDFGKRHVGQIKR